jgi:hypothetical protein
MRRAGLTVLVGLLLALPPSAGADFKTCAPVRNVFEGSRLEGDLYRIRAQAVSCRTARRVARQGTRRAVAAAPDPTGHVRVSYRRWRIVDDLRGDVDRFRARSSGRKRVRWLFGDI